jgi:glycosyltransferase involved in cell wall biosynthesis/predicted SAM-dependent methyltransferase
MNTGCSDPVSARPPGGGEPAPGPLVYVIFQSSSLANGGLESVTQILRRAPSGSLSHATSGSLSHATSGSLSGAGPACVVTQLESRFTEAWRALGCEVHVWPAEEATSAAGVSHAAARTRRASAQLEYNLRVARLVRARGAKVVHCNDIAAFWYGALGARMAGARVLFNVRDIFPEGRPYGPRWRLIHHIASEIVCLSEDMREAMRTRCPPLFPGAPGLARLTYIHSAVDLERMRPLPAAERTELRRALGMSEGAFEIAYVGAVCDKKHQLGFLRGAAPALLARVPSLRLTFVGDFRPERDAYAKECLEAAAPLGERVRFSGFDAHVERWYQAADLVVLASRYEGLPRAMIESLACGTPVAAFDVTSAREFLEQRGCGVVATRYDYDTLVQGIVRLAEDEAERLAMARRAREVAVAHFDPEKSVRSYLERYRSLAAGTPAASPARNPSMTPVSPLKDMARKLLAKRTRRGLSFDLLRLRARVRARLSRKSDVPRRLHLGCGGRIVPGFLNVDVAGSEHDIDLAAGSLPFADGAFDAVVSQQVIEHLDLESELMPLLRDLVRVLAPGGEAILACPDMEAICRSYLADGGAALLADRQKRWPDFHLRGLPPSHMVNILFHQAGEHVNLFDFTLLSHVLRECGFRAVERIREPDLLARFPELPLRDDDDFSLYVRAVR